jgi:hypothetical protein
VDPDETYETPVFGDNRSFDDFSYRLAVGAVPLLAYGVAGTVQQLFSAPFHGQIPLTGGFTIETPFSSPSIGYRTGHRGQSQTFQADAQAAGQSVNPDGPLSFIRTHTTGIIDYGVRQGWPLAEAAEELVHPGRVAQIRRESLPPPMWDAVLSSMETRLMARGIILDIQESLPSIGLQVASGIPSNSTDANVLSWFRVEPLSFERSTFMTLNGPEFSYGSQSTESASSFWWNEHGFEQYERSASSNQSFSRRQKRRLDRRGQFFHAFVESTIPCGDNGYSSV